MSDPAAARPRPRPPARASDPVQPTAEVPAPAPVPPPADAPPATAPPPAVDAAPEQPVAAYTSTVRAPAQLALGVVVAAVGAWVLVALGLWPLAVLGVLLVAAATYYLSTVTVTVTPREITLAQGRGERDPRSLWTGEITEVSAEAFTWLQCFGIERGHHGGDTRLAVRAGPTLRLTLRSEERVLVSVRDTAAAIALLPESVRRV